VPATTQYSSTHFSKEQAASFNFTPFFTYSRTQNLSMAPTSWLLSLPRELRDKIYEFVAINEDLLLVKTTPPTVERRQLASRSGLILACRQLHDEYPEDLLANSLKPDNLIIIEVIVLDGDFSRAFDFARHLTPTQCAMINGYQLLVTQWYSEHMQFGSATFLANWCHCTVRDSNLQSYIDDKKRGSDNRPCEDIELWELCEVLWTRENSPLSPRRGTTHGGISRMKRMLSVLTKIRGLTVKANMERSERRRDQRDEGLGQLTSWGAFKMPAAVLEHQGAATAGPSLATNGSVESGPGCECHLEGVQPDWGRDVSPHADLMQVLVAIGTNSGIRYSSALK